MGVERERELGAERNGDSEYGTGRTGDREN